MKAPTQSITDDLLAEIEAGNIHGSEWALTPIVNRIRALEEAQRWISFDENSPPKGKAVLWLHSRKAAGPHLYVARKTQRRNPWEFLDGGPYHEATTHWMPLPEPPR